MSQRNSLANKRLRRAERSTRKPLPAYIDLIQWVRSRSSVTAGEARRIILAGTLKSGSHTIGVKELPGPNKIKVLDRFVSASHRGEIQIVMPEALNES